MVATANDASPRRVIDAHAHPSGILRQVIDAVGRGAPEFRNQEIVHPHLLRLASRSWVRYSGLAHFDHYIWPTWVVILCIILPVLV